MFSYRFSNFKTNIDSLDFSKTCIWIIHSDKIPPHVGISLNNKFYSLKATGKDFGLNTHSVFNSLKSKQIEFVIIETKLDLEIENLEEEYHLHNHAVPIELSCLIPILRVLNIDEPFLLVDLIKKLEMNNLILKNIVINLKGEFPEIGLYSATDVALEIEKLQRAKGK
jgi:hypothetical protein